MGDKLFNFFGEEIEENTSPSASSNYSTIKELVNIRKYSSPSENSRIMNIWSKIPFKSDPVIYETTTSVISTAKSKGLLKIENGEVLIQCPITSRYMKNTEFECLQTTSGRVDHWFYLNEENDIKYKLVINNS